MAAKLDRGAVKVIDGQVYVRVTPGRARHLADALRAGQPHVAKQGKGVVTSFASIFEALAKGETLDPAPRCWVYVRGLAPDAPLAKIGHARDLAKRAARSTDSPEALLTFAAWEFGSVGEAMTQERAARDLWEAHEGTGGTEFVHATPAEVVARLTALWGEPEAG